MDETALLSAVPHDWSTIESEYAWIVEPMRRTPQDPAWHGEGDVWTHTKMVCEALVSTLSWKPRTQEEQSTLFTAALLHDCGKPMCTKEEDGRIVSPKHAKHGSAIARRFLWETLGLSGSPPMIVLRERIVGLIRRHSLPYHILDRPDPLRDIVSVSVATNCELLATLCEADIQGRIASNQAECHESIVLFRQLADENDCLEKPYHFQSDHSRYAYFSGVLEHPAQPLYDGTWGEIVLLSGLPATGKDTYIAEHLSGVSVVSLDNLRHRMNISWMDDQTPVIHAAREKAKEFLRRKQPFVWNATNLRRDFRRQVIRLCTNYGARVRIVYLESDLPTLLKRNQEREHPVDESAYEKMLDTIEVPTILEAQSLEIIGT